MSMINIFELKKIFIAFILLCHFYICHVTCATGDNCVVQKQNFATCMQELENKNLGQDDGQIKLVRNKFTGCFTDNECQPPSYDKIVFPPVNVTDRLKKHWTTLPEPVQECIRKVLREKTAIKLAACITAENVSASKPKVDTLKQAKNDSQAGPKGFKVFFQTRSRVSQYLQKCKENKGESAYLKASACVQEIINFVEDQICMRYSSCQFEKVETRCLQSNRETQFAQCKCRRDRLKITVRALGDLLEKAAHGDVTVDELANAMGHNDTDDSKKDSQLQKCFIASGIAAPNNPIVGTTSGTVAPVVITTPSLTDMFTSNIIVSKQQIENVFYLLEAKMEEETCKCGN